MTLKPVLILSLALNVALFGAVSFLLTRRPAAEHARPDPAAHAPSAAPSTTIPAPPPAAPPTPPAQSFDWRLVESEDYRKYIANLRAIGCPEETIRDIITADVNKLFESRRRELSGASTNRFEFWKAGNMFAGMFDPQKIEREQELNKERRALLRDLLGAEPEEKPDITAMLGGVNPLEAMLDFLPGSKQTQVMEVEQSFAAKLMKSFDGGVPDADSMKQMLKVQLEKEAELAKILTPQELEDYNLRMSQTAMMMRMQLAPFEPTEQEFRDIFKLKKEFDNQFGFAPVPPNDKTEREKYDAAKKEMEARLKAQLGAERFADYERSQDWAYQGIARTVQRQGLPKETGVKVYEMKKAAEAEARRVRSDNSLSAQQRQAALRAIREETERSVRQTMGDKAYDAYQKQPGANWMRQLSPDPKN